jgi:hypothetical protein
MQYCLGLFVIDFVVAVRQLHRGRIQGDVGECADP